MFLVSLSIQRNAKIVREKWKNRAFRKRVTWIVRSKGENFDFPIMDLLEISCLSLQAKSPQLDVLTKKRNKIKIFLIFKKNMLSPKKILLL